MFEVLSPNVSLEPDNLVPTVNLSCFIGNNGTFVWLWRFTGDPTSGNLTDDRYILHQNQTHGILEIQNLREKDTGVYSCEVRYENWEILVASGTASLQLNCKLGLVLTYYKKYVCMCVLCRFSSLGHPVCDNNA